MPYLHENKWLIAKYREKIAMPPRECVHTMTNGLKCRSFALPALRPPNSRAMSQAQPPRTASPHFSQATRNCSAGLQTGCTEGLQTLSNSEEP